MEVSEMKQEDPNPKATNVEFSRRRFLGGMAALAGVTATGATGLGTLLSSRSASAAEIGPAIGAPRLNDAYQNRLDQADRMFNDGIPVQVCNGDEALYPTKFANYSKGLPHNAIGEVDLAAYSAFIAALTSGNPADFELIPLGGARKLVNPQAGLAYDTEGNDSHQFAIPAAPAFASAEEAGEMVELYWMALLRDIDFNRYDTHPLAQRAADELSQLSDFRGPRQGGVVTPQTLFRDDLPGATEGPYISQFMLLGTPFGAEYVDRRMRTVVSGSDHMTNFADWLAVQNGNVPTSAQYSPHRVYIRRGRDLGEWVHIDVLFQAYFNACLILGTPPEPGNNPTGGGIGAPLDSGNPYLASATQDGFGTWGGPAIKAVLCEVATRALKAIWFQKWFVHRRLRPETFAGRVHVHKTGLNTYPIHPDVLDSEALDRVHNSNGTYLLPMVFPEGSPTHPAYGAGHATVAGACVTVLKAFFDESFVIPNPVVTRPGGAQLGPYTGGPLTVGGELNKLASNIATGRNIAGVHWRTDGIESLRLGEQVAIKVLTDHKSTFNEGGTFNFTSFDGFPVSI